MVELFTNVGGKEFKIEVRLFQGFRNWAIIMGNEEDLRQIGFGNVLLTDRPVSDEIFEAQVGVLKVEKIGPSEQVPSSGQRYAKIVSPLKHRELRRDKRFPVTWALILDYGTVKLNAKTVNLSVGGAMVTIDAASREDALLRVREGDRVKIRLALDKKGTAGWVETEADLLQIEGHTIRMRFVADSAVETKLARVLIFHRSTRPKRQL